MDIDSIRDIFQSFTDQFLTEYFQKRPMYVRGPADRFHEYLPWEGLNEILTNNALPVGNVTLVKEGKQLDLRPYFRFESNRQGPASRHMWRVSEVTRELREGATLIVDKIDDYYGPVRTLTRRFENALNTPISVNAYAGWRTMRGFDVHQDDHDTIILQVHGRKVWKLYHRADMLPLPRTGEQLGDFPSEPTWEGCLEEGDVLYLPRGSWHVATPCDVPTLHLTLALATFTAFELTSYVLDGLKSDPFLRFDVPRPHLGTICDEYVAAVAKRVNTALTAPGLLERFWRRQSALTNPRTEFSLPWGGMREVLPAGDFTIETTVRGSSPMIEEEQSGEISLSAGGKAYTFPTAAGPILRVVFAERTRAKSDLVAACRSLCTESQLEGLLTDLAESGLIVCKLLRDEYEPAQETAAQFASV